MPGDVTRVSDEDRDAVVARLREAVGAGRLDLEEFDRRAAKAYAGSTVGELRAVVADLPGPTPLGSEPVLERFGRITITPTAVHTSSRTFGLQGTLWRLIEHVRPRRVTPSWAIVAAVLGFFVIPFVSLLFLLAGEKRVEGLVQVAVWDGIAQHVVDLPVRNAAELAEIRRRVDRVRALAAA